MYLQILEPEGAKDDVVEMKEEETEDSKKVEKAEYSLEGEAKTVDVKKDDNDPSDPLRTDPNHPDNLKKAEDEKKGTSNPPTREPYRPRGRSQLFKCPKCIYKFLSQDGVDSHLKKEHDPEYVKQYFLACYSFEHYVLSPSS